MSTMDKARSKIIAVTRRVREIAVIVVVAALHVALTGGTAEAARHCTRHVSRVDAGGAGSARIVGWLCGAGPARGQTVNVLVHGGTYNHHYWAMPGAPVANSAVRAMNDAGYATYAVDRLGSGESDAPPAARVTIAASAAALHGVIKDLHAGRIGGRSFPRVVTVGHSVGSIVSAAEAAVYHDVDGLILTGYSANVGAGLGATKIASALVPAQLEPATAGKPLGYVTTRAGLRGQAFYHLPDADPAVIAADERHKDTMTAGEVATAIPAELYSRHVTTDVLTVLGEWDGVFCSVLPCSSPLNPGSHEATVFPLARSHETRYILGTGHDLALQRSARQSFDAIIAWSDRHGGPGTPAR